MDFRVWKTMPPVNEKSLLFFGEGCRVDIRTDGEALVKPVISDIRIDNLQQLLLFSFEVAAHRADEL